MSENCQICGQTGHGHHFGVVSCRACAAFFRRTVDSKWNDALCQSAFCTEDRYHCKPCRLRKCKFVGMDASKIQYDRDLILSRKRKLPPSFEYFMGKPHFMVFSQCDPIKKQKLHIDLSELIDKVQEILRNGPENVWKPSGSSLKSLGNGFNLMKMMPKEPVRVTTVTRRETTGFWQWYLLTVAKWLTHFDKFQELEEDVKLQILIAVWHVWGRLDKLMATALYRTRNKNYKPAERVIGNGLLTEITDLKADVKWMTSYPKEQAVYFLQGIRINDLFHLVDQLQSLSLCEEELNFMLGQLCFQYAANRFGGKIGEVLEGFQEVLSNDLHDFYVNHQNNPRYSGRLLKMLKINQEIQENIRKHRPRTELAKAFEIFNLEFSHPEIFKDTGYG